MSNISLPRTWKQGRVTAYHNSIGETSVGVLFAVVCSCLARFVMDLVDLTECPFLMLIFLFFVAPGTSIVGLAETILHLFIPIIIHMSSWSLVKNNALAGYLLDIM